MTAAPNAWHDNSVDADAKVWNCCIQQKCTYTSALAMLQQVQQLRSHHNMALVCNAAVTVCLDTSK